MHALTHDKYVQFVVLRLVSKTFNALIEPTVFSSVTIDLKDHFNDLAGLTWKYEADEIRKTQRHAHKMQSLALRGSAGYPSTLIGPYDESHEGSDVMNVWRWAKSLTIMRYPPVSGDQNIDQARLETLVRAIQGLKYIERVE